MVFTSPTQVDYDNAAIAALEHSKLSAYNHHLKIAPELFSWIDVEIRYNANLASVTEDQFNNALYVRLVGSKQFCNQVKCVAYYPRGNVCTEASEPRVFKSGDTDVQACHSSCFNIYGGAKDAKTGDKYKAPLTSYSKNQHCCLFHTDETFRLGVDDYVRADTHTTPRVDTIGTGFNVATEPFIDGENNETYRFLLNSYYCDDFKYKKVGDECKPSTTEYITGLIASEFLYKLGQYKVRQATTGVAIDGVQKVELPPIATPPPDDYNTWKNNINPGAHFFNPDLTLSDLGITREKSHLIFTTEYGWPGRLVEPLIVYDSVSPTPDVMVVDFSEFSSPNIVPQLRKDKYGKRYTDEYEVIGTYRALREINALAANAFGKDTSVIEKNGIAKAFHALSENFDKKDFLAMVALNSTELYVRILKRLAQSSEALLGKLTTQMVYTAQRTIFSSVAHGIGALTLDFTRLAFKILSSTLKAVTVVTLIFDLLAIVDLIVAATGYNLFHLENLHGQRAIDMYSTQDLQSKQLAFGYKTVEFSPALYLAFYDSYNPVTAEDLEANELQGAENLYLLPLAYKNFPVRYGISADNVVPKHNVSNNYRWTSEYLTRLVVNSYGQAINWTEVDSVDLKDFNEMFDNVFDTRPITFTGYDQYSKDFLKRIYVSGGLVTAVLSAIILNVYIIKSAIFSLFIILLALVSFVVATTPNILDIKFSKN